MPANIEGYCGAPSLLTPIGYQSASYYIRSKSLCPRHYQTLMDRGWRRSGALLYLPDVSRSCCPHYTIRLPAAELKPIRDQRQAINRWNRFVLGEDYQKEVSKKYPKSKEDKKVQKTTFDLVTAVHESESSSLKPDIDPAHKLVVTLEPDTFTEEKFQLFDAYQRHVHHEGDGDISRSGFKRFLCSSPLHRHPDNSNNNNSDSDKPLGSFHQTHRLDGRLIAMSVLDLLPHAVSSVYFIYHPDFEKWSFGKLSALREAALALEHGYEWLYMGYYIHSCPKMRYKADYRPQHVLDLDTFRWDPLDEEMGRLMERRVWVSMARERGIREGLAAVVARAEKDVPGEIEGRDADDETMHDVPPSTAEAESRESALAAQAYPILHPNPLDATDSNLSMLQLGVPGVMNLDELLAQIDLAQMKAAIPGYPPGSFRMGDLLPFMQGELLDARSFRGVVAEFAAAVGVEIAGEVVVDWR